MNEITLCRKCIYDSHDLHIVLGVYSLKSRKNKFKEAEVSRYIYQNDLHKPCFQHDIEILKISIKEQLMIKYYVIKQLILPKIQKHDGYQ